MTDLQVIRDAILHLVWYETGFALKIVWVLSVISVALLTWCLTYRAQSRGHVQEAERECRRAKRELAEYQEWAKNEINKLNARILPAVMEETRGHERMEQ